MKIRRFGGFTLIELLVTMAILAVLVALAMPAVQQARAAARRTTCQNRLRQLGLALHSYHDTHEILPAGAYIKGPAFPTQSGWGWGSMILPHVDQSALYQRIDFRLGTSVGSNITLLNETLPLFQCSSDPANDSMTYLMPGESPGLSSSGNYCGSHGMLSGMSSVRFADVTDGLSLTLMLGERVTDDEEGSSGPYTAGWYGFLASPSRYIFDSVPYTQAAASHPINQTLGSTNNFSSYHSGGAQFVLGDGTVRMISESIDGQVFEALGTRDEGEVVQF